MELIYKVEFYEQGWQKSFISMRTARKEALASNTSYRIYKLEKKGWLWKLMEERHVAWFFENGTIVYLCDGIINLCNMVFSMMEKRVKKLKMERREASDVSLLDLQLLVLDLKGQILELRKDVHDIKVNQEYNTWVML